MGIITVHQLPKTRATLWLRLFGRDKVQFEAITITLLIQLGMTVEEIADRLELPLESVRNASNPPSNQSKG